MKNFSKYFEKWLYEKDGYYSNYKQIGKQGDFFTSVSISPFFGGAIAQKIIKTIEDGFLPKNTTIVEIGAHHGYLLADVIQFIYTLKPSLLKSLSFAIVEPFENLEEKQKEYLQQSFTDEINIKHYKHIKELKLDNAFILANEIFDAFCCELVYTNENDVLQMAYIKEHKVFFDTCKDSKIIKHCQKYNIKKGEVCLSYEDFAQTLCSNIKTFEFLTFDYGEKVARNDFSIRIYAKHKIYPFFEENLDLKNLYKKSDITYDVHFDFLIDCFKEYQEKNIQIDFQPQSKALVQFGIITLLEILKANVSENTYLKESQKVKTLIEPTGMGDRFKMLNIKKF